MKRSNIGLAVAAVLASAIALPASAELSANIGAASNYIWRGITQTNDGAAVSGGVDYAHDNGFYAGTWVSNVDGGAEVDFYGGFGGGSDDFSWDLNTIYYYYPDFDEADFWEIGGSVGYKMVSGGLQYTIDKEGGDSGDVYYWGGLSFDLPQDFGLGLTLGHYDFEDGSDGDYTHWQVSLSKDAGDFGEFSLNYDQTDGDEEDGFDEDAKFWVGWSKSF